MSARGESALKASDTNIRIPALIDNSLARSGLIAIAAWRGLGASAPSSSTACAWDADCAAMRLLMLSGGGVSDACAIEGGLAEDRDLKIF